MTPTTIANVINGKHAHDKVVTVEGLASEPEQRDGDDSRSFLLVCSLTAVRVYLPSNVDAEQADRLARTRRGGIEHPPLVKVTGRVDRPVTIPPTVPTLIAEEIVRLEVAP